MNSIPFQLIAGTKASDNVEQKSPYLKAILSSASSSTAIVRRIIADTISDKAAALRYIKESSTLRKA
ncbi:MAG: hypothetical protein JST23_04940 [Bacteroidetes bacterium]|nr:hypothetical protein [Bacteroidota bacterium]